MTDSRDQHETYAHTQASFLVRMKEQIARLTAERDEARREVLLWVKERCSWAELSDEIKRRGWGYLKEDGK